MSPATVFRPLSIAELAALELPVREDLVEDGLLVAGSLVLFAAREKSGKTLLCTDLACCIAGEEPFLDRAVRCGPAIFVALEENIREVRGRILDRLGALRDVPLFVLPANGYSDEVFRLDDPASMVGFAAMIREHDARAVIIDTMREAHRLRENEADDMAPLVRPLRQIAHDTNCAIVLVHHMSRAGNARGSTAIAAAADQLWTFQRNENETDQDTNATPVGRLIVEGRFGPRQVLGIRLGEGLRWCIDHTLVLSDQHQSMRGLILAALRHGEPRGMTAEDLATVLDAKLKTVQNEIPRLLQEVPCPIVASGTGKRGAPRRYAVVDPELFPTAVCLGSQAAGIVALDSSHHSRNNGNHPEWIVPSSRHLGDASGGINDPAFVAMVRHFLALTREDREAYRAELASAPVSDADAALEREALRRVDAMRDGMEVF